MKKLLIAILSVILLFCCTSSTVVYADVSNDINDAVEEGLEHLDFSQVESVDIGFFDNIISSMKKIMAGEFDTTESFFAVLYDLILDNSKVIFPTIITILVMALLCSIITNNNAGFISKGTSNVVYFVVLSMIVTSLVSIMHTIISQIVNLTNNISATLDVSVPIIATLMIANGGNVTAKIYQPTVALMSTTIIKLISSVILPLCILSFVFTIISNISDNVKINKMTGFVNSLSNWVLGVSFLIFFSFLSIQGATAATMDGISIRAAKFATKNYIPLLGGYLADGFDLIMASTTLIKNSFGVVLMMSVFGGVASILVNLLVYKFSLQLIGAVGEPVLDKRFVSLFTQISKIFQFLAILLIAILFMCMMLIMLAILTCNGV